MTQRTIDVFTNENYSKGPEQKNIKNIGYCR